MWHILSSLRIRKIENDLRCVDSAQAQILKRILDQLKGCQLADRYGLGPDAGIDRFRRNVPVTDYDFYYPYVQQILAGERSVLFPGSPVCIAKTGGSTAKPKLVPLGKQLVRSYRRFNLDMAYWYMRDSGHYEILSDRMFIVVASPEGNDILPGVPVGRATSVMARIAPGVLRRRYVPKMEVLQETDISRKIKQTTLQALEQHSRIRMAAGLTPYILNAFDHLLDEAREKNIGVKTVADILPNLRVIFHGGTAFDLYTSAIRRLAGDAVEHRNIYSAAEGPIAYQVSGASPGLLPAVDQVFFEFLPASSDRDNNSRTVLLHEVEFGVPYYVLLTTQGGLLRYKIGDQVEFIQRNPPLLKVLGRTDDQIDLSGEKMAVDEAAAAIAQLDLVRRLEVADFIVCPAPERRGRIEIAHEWIIECENPPTDPADFRNMLEAELFERNERYRDLRKSGFKQPTITFVGKGTFHRYTENHLVYGQQKMLHMHNDRLMAERLLQHA